jgi:hypothetical protein
MRIACLIAAITLLLLAGQAMAASQISPRDGLWLSLPPDMVRCIIIKLPHDAGITQPGNYIFTVSCTPGPEETWTDLSEQIVYEIHENNTAQIPICFDKHWNKPLGNCSAPYTITVSEAFTGTTREWHGGICVSEHADVDIILPGEMPASGDDVMDILNDNTDIFSAWLDEEEKYAMPGESAVFNLSVQSHAELDMAILTQSELDVSPAQASLRTGPGSPCQYQAFEVTAPSTPGTYRLTVRVSPDKCQGESYCTKFLEGTLVVSEESPPEKTGFEVKLRPENIDIKKPEEVIMRLSIINNEEESRTFTSTISTDPSDGSIGFRGETVEVGPRDSHTRIFIVMPGSSSTLYETTARVESGGVVSSATSFITIDELLTDALRQAQGLGSGAQAEVSSWASSHADSSYGSNLQEYGSLRDTLASTSQDQQPVNDTNGGNGQTGPEEEPGIPWFVLPLAITAAVALIAFMFLMKKSGSGDEEGTEYY